MKVKKIGYLVAFLILAAIIGGGFFIIQQHITPPETSTKNNTPIYVVIFCDFEPPRSEGIGTGLPDPQSDEFVQLVWNARILNAIAKKYGVPITWGVAVDCRVQDNWLRMLYNEGILQEIFNQGDEIALHDHDWVYQNGQWIAPWNCGNHTKKTEWYKKNLEYGIKILTEFMKENVNENYTLKSRRGVEFATRFTNKYT